MHFLPVPSNYVSPTIKSAQEHSLLINFNYLEMRINFLHNRACFAIPLINLSPAISVACLLFPFFICSNVHGMYVTYSRPSYHGTLPTQDSSLPVPGWHSNSNANLIPQNNVPLSRHNKDNKICAIQIMKHCDV